MIRKLLSLAPLRSFPKRLFPLASFKAPKFCFSVNNENNNNIPNDKPDQNDNPNSKNDEKKVLNEIENEEPTIISNDFKTKFDAQIKDEIKLETVPLKSKKFNLSEEEKLLPQKTYVFFSSGQSIISKNNQSIKFLTSNINNK